MLFNYKYSGSSKVESNASSTSMSFAPDTLREPTFFRGRLGKNIPFREAISALHDVVISDLRYKKPEVDKSEYLKWAKEQEQQYLEEMAMQNEAVKQRANLVRRELQDIQKNQSKVLGPYHKARSEWRQLSLIHISEPTRPY